MTSSRTLSRRVTTVASALAWVVGVAVVLAGPASASPSENWENAPHQSALRTVLLLVGIPILLALLCVAGVYGPPLLRGEKVTPGSASKRDQWLGGPRTPAGELPSAQEDEVGGGSGRW